ncbi:MAG: hypothetical protein NPIRA06_33630 [Nitrospirales bacterium]|nr:MAG: hypothetical protein NPIRA06_33630 [Nitrospirales bacterium]
MPVFQLVAIHFNQTKQTLEILNPRLYSAQLPIRKEQNCIFIVPSGLGLEELPQKFILTNSTRFHSKTKVGMVFPLHLVNINWKLGTGKIGDLANKIS